VDNIRCDRCDKEFGSEDALNMHNKSKHPELYKEPKVKISKEKKRKIRNWVIFFIDTIFNYTWLGFFVF